LVKNNHNYILTIDIGNTNVDNAVFNGHDIFRRFRFDRNEIPNFSKYTEISGGYILKTAYICSVVPNFEDLVILELKKSGIKSTFPLRSLNVDKKVPLLLEGCYEGLGEDRQIALWSALRHYSAPLLVMDLGTAVTIDVVDKKQKYMGGIIVPGIQMWTKALANGTALLPEIGFEGEAGAPLLGRSTRDCISAGLTYGLSEMLNGLVKEIKNAVDGSLSVILTGGDMDKGRKLIRTECVADDTLVLKGLNELRFRNRE